ncbi:MULTISPECIES: spore coat associated protein CotJA [Lachnospiraceae]|uniref:spore coat associated protein CotJA n=1 Tax=Lachnospiraceae TaxID=186803 RepID=UPI002A79B843|nr:spore coat associated protein CotJA [Bariatricus sp.]MDY4194666.1 spore coat associated protein CotJA [Bariatricus sp.]MDY4503133.1 spore coat associated protein CotJA [Bariatricus sp.]MDY5457179.1 spore coat associated protein CotJA [Bariatricus sp.]
MAPGSAPSPYSGNRNMNSCCDRDDALEGMPLAMAYVPWQNWRKIYEPEKAFCRGTIFEELDKPFHGTGGCQS